MGGWPVTRRRKCNRGSSQQNGFLCSKWRVGQSEFPSLENPPTPSPQRGRRTGRVVTAQVQGGLVNEHIRKFNIISVSNTVIVASFAPQRCVFLHLSSVGLESIGDAEDATMIVIFRATIIVVILIFLLSDQICVIYVSSALLDPVGDAEDA